MLFVHGPAQAQVTDKEYLRRVHHGDLIDVHVKGHIDFDWRGRLSPEGFLDGFDKLPEQVFALCRTESEIAASLDRIFSAYLREPKTEVKIIDVSRRPSTIIDGAVATPTRFQIRREVRLAELITLAGGISDRSNGKIGIIRPPGQSCFQSESQNRSKISERNPFEISVSELIGGDPSSNPFIVSGDLIVIAEAQPVFVVGAVATQGRLDLRPGLSVSRAIDSAGGTLKEAELTRVTVFRRNGATRESIVVDLGRARSDPSLDIQLLPFDIIDVSFRGRPPRRLPPIYEAEREGPGVRDKYPLKIIE